MLQKIHNPIDFCDLKFADDKTGEFEGYGSVFDSNDLGNDTIRKGAFVDALDKSLPKMFINHNHMDIPVGDYVDAKEDDHGLLVVGKIDLKHHLGPSVYSAMMRKAMDGLSIGAVKSTLQFENKANGGRDITKADLREVSVVTFPMEESATILSVKSYIEEITSFKDAENILRELGCSKSAALVFVSRIKDLVRRDTGTNIDDEIAKQTAMTNHLVEFINKL